MAPSRWRGREPVTTTEFEYDDEGRLLRATTRRQPEWLDSDRAESLALLVEDALRCSGCGQPTDESMLDDAEGAYTVEPPVCHACAALEFVAKDIDQRGTYLRVVKKRPISP